MKNDRRNKQKRPRMQYCNATILICWHGLESRDRLTSNANYQIYITENVTGHLAMPEKVQDRKVKGGWQSPKHRHIAPPPAHYRVDYKCSQPWTARSTGEHIAVHEIINQATNENQDLGVANVSKNLATLYMTAPFKRPFITFAAKKTQSIK